MDYATAKTILAEIAPTLVLVDAGRHVDVFQSEPDGRLTGAPFSIVLPTAGEPEDQHAEFVASVQAARTHFNG